MVKWKFGDPLRCIMPTALTKVALAKHLRHKVIVLIHETHKPSPAMLGSAQPSEPHDEMPGVIRFLGA